MSVEAFPLVALLPEALAVFAERAGRALPAVLSYNALHYALGACGAFALVNRLFANPLAGRRIRDGARIPKGQILRELSASARTILTFTAVGAAIAAGAEAGLFQIGPPGERSWAYFAASVLTLIVAHDAWFYWTHRLLHDPRLFRRLHRLHHRSHAPTPFTSFAFNVGEAVLHAAYLPLILLVLPASLPALAVFGAHMMLRNAIGHCGIELFPARWDGRPVFGWLTTVTHHDLHHADPRWNFGLYFSWWDKLMGTEHPEYEARFAAATKRWLDPKMAAPDPLGRAAAVIAAAVVSAAALASADARAEDASAHPTRTGVGILEAQD